jgi:hypothetical protein
LIGIAFGAPVRTLETVLCETPLASAMSCMVGMRLDRAVAEPAEVAGWAGPTSRVATFRRMGVELRFGLLAAISLKLLR